MRFRAGAVEAHGWRPEMIFQKLEFNFQQNKKGYKPKRVTF
jgi:hypothetical protein